MTATGTQVLVERFVYTPPRLLLVAALSMGVVAEAATFDGIDFIPECPAPCADSYNLVNSGVPSDTPVVFDLGIVSLADGISVQAITPASARTDVDWDFNVDTTTLALQADTAYHVFLFHFDTVTGGPTGNGVFERDLGMLFDQAIVGVVVDNATLRTMDPLLVPEHITVDSFGGNRGLELNGLPFGPNDFVTFQSDQEITSRSLRNRAGYDQAFIFTEVDNCPDIPDSDQTDFDEDGIGDVCDDDVDGDDVLNVDDNCPTDPNDDQLDTDDDDAGDVCDDDDDGDGFLDGDDNCPAVANDQTDTDDDDDGDTCDDDDDDDDIVDTEDNCRIDANTDQTDTDEDERGDVCDDDDDGDGFYDGDDNCPSVANDQTDTDDDDDGDACDDNDDGDAHTDDVDNCDVTANDDQTDTDDDDVGDACDDDDDNDNVADEFDCAPTDDTVSHTWTFYADDDEDGFGDPDEITERCIASEDGWSRDNTDNCPDAFNPVQADADRDGFGDACDDDADGDNQPDLDDNCPLVNNPNQVDSDDDGFGDACDSDEDGDDVDNDEDNCPMVANADQADLDADDIGDACDVDADGDDVNNPADCDDLDDTLSDLVTYYQDADGDGFGTTAADVCANEAPDGFVDAGGDNCPDVANDDQADANGNGVGDACDTALDTGLDINPDGDLDAGSCGCQTGSPAGTLPVGLLLLLALRRRRSST